jgi:hypothetical protein
MSDTHGRTRHTDPSTSHEAGQEIDATKLENDAFQALRRDGGWRTYFEWSALSGIKYSSLTPRGKQLWLDGRVDREKRPGLNDLGKVKNLLHFHARRVRAASRR